MLILIHQLDLFLKRQLHRADISRTCVSMFIIRGGLRGRHCVVDKGKNYEQRPWTDLLLSHMGPETRQGVITMYIRIQRENLSAARPLAQERALRISLTFLQQLFHQYLIRISLSCTNRRTAAQCSHMCLLACLWIHRSLELCRQQMPCLHIGKC